jgi:hypothetical protein
MPADARQVVLNRLAIAGGITLRVIGSRARQTLATHHGRLLVGKGDQLDAMPQAQALVLKSAASFQTGQHPQGPIKTSTGGNRVEVRAGHQSRTIGIEAFKASDQVASSIDTHLHAELLHPVGQQLTALHILRRETRVDRRCHRAWHQCWPAAQSLQPNDHGLVARQLCLARSRLRI